jgi:hypothetical protein
VQHGGGRIEREIGAGFNTRAVPALRLIVTDHGHVIGENPAEARILELCRARLAGGRLRRSLDIEFQPGGAIGFVERNSHSLSPGLTRPAPERRRACYA